MDDLVDEPSDPKIPVSGDSLAILSPAEVRDLRKRQSEQTHYIDRLHDSALEKLFAENDVKSLLLRTRAPAMRRLLAALADPRNRKKSLSRMARTAGVDYMDLIELMRDDSLSRGTVKLMSAWPDIANDVVKDSMSSKGNCPDCGGEKKLSSVTPTGRKSSRKCHRCNGTGAVNLPGNAEARKLAAQAIGVIKSGSGPSININNNLSVSRHDGPECVIDALEKLDNSSAGIIEAEFETITDDLGEIGLD